VVFFERDVAYYAAHRDLTVLPGGKLVLYRELRDVLSVARQQLADADVAIVTSYCADAVELSQLVLAAQRPLHVFYDLDTPVTLARVRAGQRVEYLGPRALRDFDLVLTFTGGPVLAELARALGAKRCAVLYGSVDPAQHGPTAPADRYRADLSYLGTYAQDRQAVLDRLFIAPARVAAQRTFLIGGAQYPQSFPWTSNTFFVRHVPPPEHSTFYSSSRFTLNVTRAAMADMGFCPSGRLFEAAACGAPLISDAWQGLEQFFVPGEEIIVARTTGEVLDALAMDDAQRLRIARAAQRRVLTEHTADTRAQQLEQLLERAYAERHGAPALPAGRAAAGA
jgi:spore maturation protein CgeB